MTREEIARVIWFVFGDDMSVTSAESPLNDAHWKVWRDDEIAKSAFVAADYILSRHPEPLSADDIHECGQQSGLMYARILVGEFLSESHPDLNDHLQAELEMRGDAIECRRSADGEVK